MAFNYEYPYTDPNIYNDDWLLKKMKELLAWMEGIEEWKTEYQQAYNDYKQMIDDIENGTFPDSIVNAFNSWMGKNAINLVGQLVKMVFFGLTNDGYFIAYIPESWKDIIFGTTGLDDFPSSVPYGHLTLTY